MAEPSLEFALTKWLIEQRPALLAPTAAIAAEVCAALADVLGANLATVYVKGGPDAYLKALGVTMHRVNEAAFGTLRTAVALADGGEVGGHG